MQVPASGRLFATGPQRLASVPPQTSVPVQVPHFTTPPQRVSVTKSQLAFNASQLEGQPSAEFPPLATMISLPPLALSPLLPPLPLPLAASTGVGLRLTLGVFPQPEAATK